MLRDNVFEIRERIASLSSGTVQNPYAVTIIAVSKGRTTEEIKEAVEAGIKDIGENKVQEAIVKYNDMQCAASNKQIKWHMVGHLQTNKAKEAVKIFDLIQSIDSLHLAVEIDKQAARINKIQDALIEAKTSDEATKFGLKPEETIEVIKEMSKLKNINIKGLMTIASAVINPEDARPYFRKLRELKDKINVMKVTQQELQILSMGMSDDFAVAIEEGANMIRLGRAIFE